MFWEYIHRISNSEQISILIAMARFIRVRWQDNNSPQFDNTVQDVELKYVSEEDILTMATGSIVHVQMSRTRNARKWTGVVVDLLNDEDILSVTSDSDSDMEFDDDEPSPKPKAKAGRKAGAKGKGKAKQDTLTSDSDIESCGDEPSPKRPKTKAGVKSCGKATNRKAADDKAGAKGKGKSKQRQTDLIVHVYSDSQVATPETPADPQSVPKRGANPVDAPMKRVTELLQTIQQNQAIIMQKLLHSALPPCNMAPLTSNINIAPPPGNMAPPSALLPTFQQFGAIPARTNTISNPIGFTNYSHPIGFTPYVQKQAPVTPPTRPQIIAEGFSSRRPLENITTRFTHEKDASRMSVLLAMEYFYGKKELAQNTPGTLEASSLERIRSIVLSKFGWRKSQADKEALWLRCRVAIGHKCKQLRNKAKCFGQI